VTLSAGAPIWNLVAAALVAALAQGSWRSATVFAQTTAAPHFRARRAAAVLPLGVCLLAVLAANPHAALAAGIATGLAGAAAFLLYTVLDPDRPMLWHHRRLRPLAVGSVIAAGLLLGWSLPAPELAPLAFAVLIHLTHQRRSFALAARLAADLDGLTSRSLALDAALRTATLLVETREARKTAGDKPRSAS
jgi:hypothetical protein